jgi:hypothetical protein
MPEVTTVRISQVQQDEGRTVALTGCVLHYCSALKAKKDWGCTSTRRPRLTVGCSASSLPVAVITEVVMYMLNIYVHF